MMLAQQCDLEPGEFVLTFGDVHLYSNHLNDPAIVAEQLSRTPGLLPELRIIRRPASLFDYCYEDFQLEGYQPQPGIRAPIAI